MGKTRVAIAVAERVAGSFLDGVWWADLTVVERSGDVADIVPACLGVQRRDASDVSSSLASALQDRGLLVDPGYCEHVIDQVAAVVDSLTRDTDGPVIVATSKSGWPSTVMRRPGSAAGDGRPRRCRGRVADRPVGR